MQPYGKKHRYRKTLLCPQCHTPLESRIVFDQVTSSYHIAWICECPPDQAEGGLFEDAHPGPSMPPPLLSEEDMDEKEKALQEQAQALKEGR